MSFAKGDIIHKGDLLKLDGEQDMWLGLVDNSFPVKAGVIYEVKQVLKGAVAIIELEADGPMFTTPLLIGLPDLYYLARVPKDDIRKAAKNLLSAQASGA